MQSGFEPPLSRLEMSGAFSEAVVCGYIRQGSAAVAVVGEHTLLTARSFDSLDSHPFPTTNSTIHFAVAWADGRICLCDIVSSTCSRAERPDVSGVYQWKAVRCVQTGLYLFKVNCIHLQKHWAYDNKRNVLSEDNVLCIVTSRTGQTFFVSTTNYADDIASPAPQPSSEVEILPETVCCFESSTILRGSKTPSVRNDSDHCNLSEQDIRNMISSGSSIMIRDFTTSKK